MHSPSWRSLIVPAVLAVTGFCLSLAAARLGLPAESLVALLVRTGGGIVMWLAIAWLVSRAIDFVLHRLAIVARGGVPYPRLLTDLLRSMIMLGAVLVISVNVLGYSATGFLTLSSVMLAVIGFALRNVIGDLFAGVAMSIDDPYHIGDWIETSQGAAGKVSEITWRTTRLTDRNGVTIVLPNGLVASQRLNNYSSGGRDYRASLRVPLDSALPEKKAKRLLLSGALDADRSMPGLSPDVLLADYADGAAVYMIRFRVPDLGREAACRNAVASRVLNALQCAGLTLKSVSLPPPPPPAWNSERDALLAQGDPGDCLCILGQGVMEVSVARTDGPPISRRLAPGEVFGEMALLTGQARTATVTATLDSIVYEIHHQHLDTILKHRPAIAEGLAAVMAEHFAYNAHFDAVSVPEAMATREDFLAKLRHLFGL
jgi:small-conductance mechanosensitive channel